MSPVTELSRNGLANADALVRASLKVGLPMHIAAAFAQQESNGRNIYGHDIGGVFTVLGKNIEVTKENYAIFYQKVVIEKKRSNGVGPMQITYPGYFPVAKQQGFKLWEPHDNFVFGFKIIFASLNSDYSDNSLNRAAQRYNSGSPTGAPSYGSSVVSKAKDWKAILDEVAPRQGVNGPYPLPYGEYFAINDGTPKTHSGARAKDTDSVKRIQREVLAEVDGRFGLQTDRLVKVYQKKHGLAVDGRVGPATWNSMSKNNV